MPSYYKTSIVVDNLNTANSSELTTFKNKLDNTLNQFFIDSSDFTLERWESELGLEINNSLDVDSRRTRIKSKIRGQGTVTVNLIKNVAESFINGEVTLTENNASYEFTIKFISTKGIPPNIEDFQKSIEEIKPAHLAYKIEYTYNTYNYLAQKRHMDFVSITYEQLRTISFI